MTPGWEKRFLGLKTSGFHFQEQPLRLAAVYFLSKRVTGPTFSITPSANTAEALMSLISDSYATNFLDTSQRRNEFEILSRFVQQVPLRSVAAVADMMRIDALCKAIVEDVHMIDALKHPSMSMA